MEAIPKNPILEFLPDTLTVIRKIYDLEDGRMDQSLDILEEWMKKQKHFKNKNFSRPYLEKTVIACKGSVEKAKQQIDKLCTLKTLLPKFFISSDLKNKFSTVNKKACIVPLPKMTEDYERIVLIKIDSKEFTSSYYSDLYRLAIIIAEYLKKHDYVNGFVIVEDLRQTNVVEIVSKINIVEFQQLMTILTEGFGARLRGIHVISQSIVVDVLINAVKSLLSPKLAQRVHLYGHIEDMHEIVDIQLLPVDFGGNEKPLKQLQDEWMEILESEENEKYLAEMQASCTDESLRKADKFNEDCMGLPGSFRTLTVD